VTSNEVWFADRYSWMFVLGTRAHSMYDQGMWKNLVDFFWSGNLCAENYTVPKMNEHLQKVTHQYAAKIKSQQAGRFAGQQQQPQPGGFGSSTPTLCRCSAGACERSERALVPARMTSFNHYCPLLGLGT
jgi:hypothetical protein